MTAERMQSFSELVGGPALPRQNARKLSHFVARDLRGLILRGVLEPGQALPAESDLMQAFGVSRNTLREALRILESESLIEIKRGRAGGAVVRRPHPGSVARYVALLLQTRHATVAQIQEARSIIEPGGAARLVDTIAPETLEVLAAMHEGEVALLDHREQFAGAVTRFDRAVFELAGNKTITVLSTVFRDIITMHRFVEGGRPPGRATREKLANFHQSFLDAVAAHDVKVAEDVWRAYLAQIATLYSRSNLDDPFDVVPFWRIVGPDDAGAVPSQSNTRAATIANELRIRIALGELHDGDQLPAMAELASEFGVSRPTMRECLRVLEMEGLVDLRTGSRTGATVLAPTAANAAHLAIILLASAQTSMADVAEALRLIEPSVVELMAARIDDASLARLIDEVRELKDLVDNTVLFVATHEAVMQHAVAAVSNPAVLVAWEMLHAVAVECRRDLTISALSVPKVIRGNRSAYEALESFVEAADRRDVDAARAARTQFHDSIAPFFASALGDRLIVDLFD